MYRKPIPFAKPDITSKEIDAVVRVLKNGWLTMGQETTMFEQEFSSYVHASHAISVNSCTSALFLALKSLGVGKGDEVIVPSFTFAATANVIVHCGAKPVFVDINPVNFTIDPQEVYKKINKKTKAVIVVHYAGNKAVASFPVPVIEDSAHLVAKRNATNNIVCYSFYATKNLTTGEGGMITTENSKIAQWLQKARLHGLSRDAWKRYDPKSNWRYDVEFSGYKCNMIDLQAAIGRIQLQRLNQLETKRRKTINSYNILLNQQNIGTHLYPILVQKQGHFIDYMKRHDISCSSHFIPLHKTKAFRKYASVKLPVTEYIGDRIVTLPLYPTLIKKEIEYISEKILAYGSFKKQEYGLSVLV